MSKQYVAVVSTQNELGLSPGPVPESYGLIIEAVSPVEGMLAAVEFANAQGIDKPFISLREARHVTLKDGKVWFDGTFKPVRYQPQTETRTNAIAGEQPRRGV
jgi:hypothetical protein